MRANAKNKYAYATPESVLAESTIPIQMQMHNA